MNNFSLNKWNHPLFKMGINMPIMINNPSKTKTNMKKSCKVRLWFNKHSNKNPKVNRTKGKNNRIKVNRTWIEINKI